MCTVMVWWWMVCLAVVCVEAGLYLVQFEIRSHFYVYGGTFILAYPGFYNGFPSVRNCRNMYIRISLVLISCWQYKCYRPIYKAWFIFVGCAGCWYLYIITPWWFWTISQIAASIRVNSTYSVAEIPPNSLSCDLIFPMSNPGHAPKPLE